MFRARIENPTWLKAGRGQKLEQCHEINIRLLIEPALAPSQRDPHQRLCLKLMFQPFIYCALFIYSSMLEAEGSYAAVQ